VTITNLQLGYLAGAAFHSRLRSRLSEASTAGTAHPHRLPAH
jgi:hypothetical protein